MIRPAAAELTLGAALLLAAAAVADAQPGAPDLDAELRAAELFDLGLDRKRAGDLDGACAAFAESQALDAALGTQLNLAACLEREGRLAEARALLRATLDEATRSHDRSRADHARAELARLDAVDPGGDPADRTTGPAPTAGGTAPTSAATPPTSAAMAPVLGSNAPATPARGTGDAARASRVPFALGLGAGALTATGVALILWGHEQQDRADAACPVIGQPSCDPSVAQPLNDAAVMKSRLGVGLLIGGVVIAETALYLWWRGRDGQRDRRTGRHTGLQVGPGGAVLTYEGTLP